VARRRAAGLPVNLDTNTTNNEKRNETGQSAAPSSITIEETNESKPSEKVSDNKTVATNNDSGPKEKVEVAKPVSSPTTSVKPLDSKASEVDERVKTAVTEALVRAAKTPKQFKKWTKAVHDLALSILPSTDANPGIQLLTLAVRNTGRENLKLVSGSPDLFVEMRDEQHKPINLESVRKLHLEASDTSGEVQPGKTVYFVIAYASPVLGSHQQLKLTVGQTSAADEPASIAVVNRER